jgi:acetyl-CoA acetyltransferase family protein
VPSSIENVTPRERTVETMSWREHPAVRYTDVAIPLGAAWSSPFAKWQGTLAETSSLDLAAAVTERALADRELSPTEIDGLVLGWTVPQPDIFYGAPSLAARLGLPGVTGPMVSQACATSVAALHAAAGAIEGGAGPQLVVAADRTSNGPTLSWPAPSRQGGAPVTEHWVLDSFARDPGTGQGMLATGETVASESGFTRDEADAVAVLRSEQYASALADDRAFQRRYMVPVSIPGKRRSLELDADEGVRPVDAETAGKLPPATPEGIHTFASQTHPADGAAGAVVTTADRARALGDGVVRLLAAGFARVAPAHMPQAPVPAARAALASAGLDVGDLHAVTTHNPFAVNDLYFSRETGIALEDMNTRGCSLVFGHPQGPTGLRSIAELIETLRERGGGRGLFTGCAAGDTGAALVVEVDA